MNLNGTEYYYIRNAQGDIIGLFDKTGTQVVAYTYDTWGKLISTTGTLASTVGVKNPYRYRGYRYDTETGLYYLNARYYNAEWGRFINADAYGGKVGNLLSHNEFAYSMNNPVNMSDPSGNWPSLGGIFQGAKKIVNNVVNAIVSNVVKSVAIAAVALTVAYGVYVAITKPQAFAGAMSGVSAGVAAVTKFSTKVVSKVKGIIKSSNVAVKTGIPKAENLKMTQTVQNHINDIIKKGPNKGELSRPYVDSNGTNLLLQEIMNSGTPVKDKVLSNALRWDIKGSFRGSSGTWELVVNLDSNTIVRFNFVK